MAFTTWKTSSCCLPTVCPQCHLKKSKCFFWIGLVPRKECTGCQCTGIGALDEQVMTFFSRKWYLKDVGLQWHRRLAVCTWLLASNTGFCDEAADVHVNFLVCLTLFIFFFVWMEELARRSNYLITQSSGPCCKTEIYFSPLESVSHLCLLLTTLTILPKAGNGACFGESVISVMHLKGVCVSQAQPLNDGILPNLDFPLRLTGEGKIFWWYKKHWCHYLATGEEIYKLEMWVCWCIMLDDRKKYLKAKGEWECLQHSSVLNCLREDIFFLCTFMHVWCLAFCRVKPNVACPISTHLSLLVDNSGTACLYIVYRWCLNPWSLSAGVVLWFETKTTNNHKQ